jgi:2-keto-4-pentenoate hydratase/2-oxohepta-3-ene-1,7-dioic acid hydratase in catechol pathway
MRFVTFEVGTPVGPVARIGVVTGQNIIDLHAVYASYLREARAVYRWRELALAIVPTDMLGFIEGGEMAMDAAHLALKYFEKEGSLVMGRAGEKQLYRLDEVKLMAPVPRPVSIRDCSTFPQHSMNMRATKQLPPELPALWYEIPSHYRTSSTVVIGPDEPILWPSYTEQLDYEMEVAICIGRYGVNIAEERAEEHIFGYTIFNDVSARDIQQKEMGLMLGPGKGKSFENSNVMGPWLVTPDELDPENLQMTTRVNGEVWSEGNTRDMFFKFPRLISHLSKDDPVHPGEFIGSGTVGFGSGMELNRWLKPGDTVELEVESIGILRNRVERRNQKNGQ